LGRIHGSRQSARHREHVCRCERIYHRNHFCHCKHVGTTQEAKLLDKFTAAAMEKAKLVEINLVLERIDEISADFRA
jgi:hypothetical protein